MKSEGWFTNVNHKPEQTGTIGYTCYLNQKQRGSYAFSFHDCSELFYDYSKMPQRGLEPTLVYQKHQRPSL